MRHPRHHFHFVSKARSLTLGNLRQYAGIDKDYATIAEPLWVSRISWKALHFHWQGVHTYKQEIYFSVTLIVWLINQDLNSEYSVWQMPRRAQPCFDPVSLNLARRFSLEHWQPFPTTRRFLFCEMDTSHFLALCSTRRLSSFSSISYSKGGSIWSSLWDLKSLPIFRPYNL